MLARFVWFYLKVVLAFVSNLTFAAGILGWQYGFQALLKPAVLYEVRYLWIGVPIVALVVTSAHFISERGER
jgi:hypothetical protein